MVIQRLHYIFLLWVLGLHDLAGVESPKVLKGSHKTGAMRVSFYICIPRLHYKFENAFFGKHFFVKMHDICVNAIPVLVYCFNI